MRLVVFTTQMRTSDLGSAPIRRYHEGTLKYATQDGELDILDSDEVVIATYNSRGWESVVRERGENEPWPEWLLKTAEQMPEGVDVQFDDEESPEPHGPIRSVPKLGQGPIHP